MPDDDDLESIAEQNSPYGNVGTREHAGPKRGHIRRIDFGRKPKWKNQLRAFKIAARKRKESKT